MRLHIFFLIAGFCAYSVLYAQEMGFHIEVQTRFIQRLSWPPHEYALRYEVEIEKKDDGTYSRFLLEETTEAAIQVSLTPGNYRYRVIPFDLLNRPGIISEWHQFEIKQALNPEITGFAPEIIILQDNTAEYKLIIFGNNFLHESEFYLQRFNSSDLFIPFDVQIFNEGTEAHLSFYDEHIPAGAYQIIVKNPGGLETQSGGLVVQYPVIPEIVIQETVIPEPVIYEPPPAVDKAFGMFFFEYDEVFPSIAGGIAAGWRFNIGRFFL